MNEIFTYETKNIQAIYKENVEVIETPLGALFKNWILKSLLEYDNEKDEEYIRVELAPENSSNTKKRFSIGVQVFHSNSKNAEPMQYLKYDGTNSYSGKIDLNLNMDITYYKLNIQFQAISSIESLPMMPNSIASYLSEALSSSKLADITIKTSNEEEIRANKLILTRSPVFDAMLNRHDTKEAQESVIEITDIAHDVLKEMIHYMYTDQVPKLKEMAFDLMVAANKYDLPGLRKICKASLVDNYSLEEFLDQQFQLKD